MRREQIVRATIRCLARDGYAGLAMKRVTADLDRRVAAEARGARDARGRRHGDRARPLPLDWRLDMTMPPEQVKAKAYLRERGTEAPVAQIRERVAEAFAAMDTFLDGVTEAHARHQPGGGEWSVHEILDHLVETHPRALEEMRALLENRHSPVSPIPAGLQSAAPLARRWDDLRAELRRLHGLVLEVLAVAPDRLTEARAPIVMVINARHADGTVKPLHWIEECDWKACAVIFRLHELDHLSQARKTRRSRAN